MREILVCVTFREFDGSENAKIQEVFLDSIKNQTYKKYKIIAANYREKNVKKTLEEKMLPHVVHQSKKDCMCSWSEVIRNSFCHIEKGKHIVLWTNADNFFEPNLFQEIIDHFEPNTSGTSYPHIPYGSLSAFGACQAQAKFWRLDPKYWVPDTIFIDGDSLIEPRNNKLFEDHEFMDRWPGMAQTIVLAFFAKRRINLFFRSKIATISNVRAQTKAVKEISAGQKVEESEAKKIWRQKFAEIDRQGYITLDKFCQARGIDHNYLPKGHYLHKLYQHEAYAVIGSILQVLMFGLYLNVWKVIHTIRRGASIFKRVIKTISKKRSVS